MAVQFFVVQIFLCRSQTQNCRIKRNCWTHQTLFHGQPRGKSHNVWKEENELLEYLCLIRYTWREFKVLPNFSIYNSIGDGLFFRTMKYQKMENTTWMDPMFQELFSLVILQFCNLIHLPWHLIHQEEKYARNLLSCLIHEIENSPFGEIENHYAYTDSSMT